MKCQCCHKQKAELIPYVSTLIKGMRFLFCQECVDKKHEPRYIVILKGRQDGWDSVVEIIKAKRYHGNDILATELL